MNEGQHEPVKEASAGEILVSVLNACLLGFGAWELLPKYGATAATAISVVILLLWIFNGRATKARRAWKGHRWSFLKYAWEPTVAGVVLIITIVLCVIGTLPFTWAQAIYRLQVGNSLPFDSDSSVLEVTQMFPAITSADENQDDFLKQKARFRIWRNLIGKGAQANGTTMYCIRAKPFDNDFSDTAVTYTVADGYTVHDAFAFLEHDNRVSVKDKRHRPVLRQMPASIQDNLRTVEVKLDAPAKGESVLLLLRVDKASEPLKPVVIDRCFINRDFKVP